MNKLKEIDFNLSKINFEFKNQIVIIYAEPYKIFQDVKNIALDKFIDIFGAIPKNLHFYYQGKDLEIREQDKIAILQKIYFFFFFSEEVLYII